MRRRALLRGVALAGVASLAGCSGGSKSGGTAPPQGGKGQGGIAVTLSPGSTAGTFDDLTVAVPTIGITYHNGQSGDLPAGTTANLATGNGPYRVYAQPFQAEQYGSFSVAIDPRSVTGPNGSSASVSVATKTLSFDRSFAVDGGQTTVLDVAIAVLKASSGHYRLAGTGLSTHRLDHMPTTVGGG